MTTRTATPTRRIAARWLPVLLWMGLIFFLSSRQTLPKPPGVSANLEAIAGHLTVYAVLALLLCRALGGRGWPWRRRAALAFALAVLYGLSDEWHQSFVPGRDASPFDVGVDAIGAAIALLGGRVLTEARRWPGVAHQAGDGDQGQDVGQGDQQVLRDR
jgi:VanZ family protein